MHHQFKRAAWVLLALGLTAGCDRAAPSAGQPKPLPPAATTPVPTASGPARLTAPPAGSLRAQMALAMSREQTMKETTLNALARIGRPAVPALIEALQDHDPALRQVAARVIARIGPDAAEATDNLIVLLDDSDEAVRKSAVRALGQIGPPAAKAVPTLIDILKRLELPATQSR
jgi:HEAT repeat protein